MRLNKQFTYMIQDALVLQSREFLLDPLLQRLRINAHRPSSSRAMITRMISLVPSRIRCTRRSRKIRSTG